MSSGFLWRRRLANVDPLSPTEDAFWRALMRIVASLPGRLDQALSSEAGISANEYLTLTALSDAPGRELRMSELAKATALSASRMTRLVDQLQSGGFVTKQASAEDARGNVAQLTRAGLTKLGTARRIHVSSARALVFDHLEPGTTSEAARALAEIAAQLENRI